jgi:hypothetical protein
LKLVLVFVLVFSTTCKSLSYFSLCKFTSYFVPCLMLKDHSLERFHSKRSLFLNTFSFSLLTNQHIYKHEKRKTIMFCCRFSRRSWSPWILFKWLWLSLPLPNRLHRCSLSVRSRRWFRVLLRPKSLSWVIIIYNTCIALIFIYIELIIRINSWCNNRGDLVSLLIYNNTTKW